MSSRDLLRRGVLLHVVAQSALQRRYAGSGRNVRGALADAGFDKELIGNNVDEAHAAWSRGLAPPRTPTEWSDYDRTHSYDAGRARGEGRLRPRAAETRRWRLAWDLGCNTGTFSRSSSRTPSTSSRWTPTGWRSSGSTSASATSRRRRRILPLVVNLADASPNQGWRGAERKDLAARGAPGAHALPGAGPPRRHHRQHPAGRASSTGSPSLGSVGGDRVRRARGRDGAGAAGEPRGPVRRLHAGDLPRACCPSASTSARRRRSRAASARSSSPSRPDARHEKARPREGAGRCHSRPLTSVLRVELDDQVRLHLHRIGHVGERRARGRTRRSAWSGRRPGIPARRAPASRMASSTSAMLPRALAHADDVAFLHPVGGDVHPPAVHRARGRGSRTGAPRRSSARTSRGRPPRRAGARAGRSEFSEVSPCCRSASP